MLFSGVFSKVRTFVECQLFVGKQKLKFLPLQPVVSNGPFQQCGLDFIGEINPHYFGKHRWILITTSYFTKWIEAIPNKNSTETVIIDFLEKKHFSKILLS